jgi:hypothetical protein
MIKIFHLIFCFLLCLTWGCSQGQQTQSNFVISMAAMGSEMSFNGGILLRLINTTNGTVIQHELKSSKTVTIPYGTWTMHLVGFEGSNWTGPHKCGGLNNVVLSQPEQTLNIVVTTANCSNQPYPEMIKSKESITIGIWDSSKWDEAKWGN